MNNQTIILKNIRYFDIEQTLESGQCFRWEKIDEKQYIGCAYNRVIKIGQINNDIYIDNSNEKDMKYIWTKYFDLNRDYGKMQKILAQDKILKKAITYANGIHILQQQPFETLITYIISANNNIPRIKGIVKNICEDIGTKIEFKKNIYYTFPTVEKLAFTPKKNIDKYKAGFRGPYISKTAKMIYENKYDFKKLQEMSYEQAKTSLKQFIGVGDKVSDCVLLFTGIKTESFPVDVWVKRVMERLYFKKETSLVEINKYGVEKFDKYAGFANTYLFYYIRNNIEAI